jgi:hypothetical protein
VDGIAFNHGGNQPFMVCINLALRSCAARSLIYEKNI